MYIVYNGICEEMEVFDDEFYVEPSPESEEPKNVEQPSENKTSFLFCKPFSNTAWKA